MFAKSSLPLTHSASSVQRSAFSIRLLACSLASLALLASAACETSASGATSGGSESAATAAHPLIGSAAPDFTVDVVNAKKGKQFSIADVKGKVIIVDFWATWCGPCKKSFPKLQGLYAKYSGSGLELVGVSEDEENSGLVEFGASLGAKFPLGWDGSKKIADKWQPKSMPTTFVVDRNGIVRFAHLGYHEGDETEIEKEVKSLL